MASRYLGRIGENWDRLGELLPSRRDRIVAMLRFSIPISADYADTILEGESFYDYGDEKIAHQFRAFGNFALKHGAAIPADKIEEYNFDPHVSQGSDKHNN